MTRNRSATLTGAIHPNCRCVKCRAGNAAWQAERRQGIADGTWQPYTDAGPVREHVEEVHASGLSYIQIAAAAEVSLSTVQHLRTAAPGRRVGVRPELAAAILAVQPVPSLLRLPARANLVYPGAMRRVQALRAAGWPCPALADRCPLTVRTLTRAAGRPEMAVATARGIVALYDGLHDQDPRRHGIEGWFADRTARYAARNGWAVPAAWADIDADGHPDRRITAPRYAAPALGGRGRDVIEDTAELAANGCTRDEVAARVGIGWEAVAAAHRRAGVGLPLALRLVRGDEDEDDALPDEVAC